MFESRAFTFAVGLICLVYFARPALAFGAGNIASISKIEGQNWRHGDIEDALLRLTMAKAFGGKKFSKHNVSRVYFGNWLRDYSQAIDVGTVKSVSAEAIRLLLSVLGFMTFGFGSQEFEITTDRLGCYRPEEHIDNPKNYADNEDARRYYERLRGPVDESVELAIDEETGMKNYIANEQIGIDTSAGLCRDLISRSIRLGRSYARSGDKSERNESLRLMGTALHCLEDFFAHSNYTELALIELGEQDVFPHVGRNTQMRIPGVRHSVYPLVTGTFGGVDFLHSVTGEVSDKLTQNEIQELEGTLEESSQADTSHLRELLDKIPDGVFGGENQSEKVDKLQADAAAAQSENVEVSPREPEEFTLYVQKIFRQIMPVLEWHDNIVKKINNAMEKIPVLPKIMEQLGDQMSIFIFSIIAPLILPVIRQIRNEMKTGSDALIESSEKEQFVVFHDDNSTDPTHSMLAKDHFSNILNEVAGRCAAYTVRWVVPQIMDAIDDEGIDINRTVDRITGGILHHPAQRHDGRDGASEGRELLFRTVEEWWQEGGSSRQEQYRYKLSRRGVKNMENHKEGVYDTGHGHGCVGKLKMRKQFGEEENWEDKVADKVAGSAVEAVSGALSGIIAGKTGDQNSGQSEGGLGGIIGGIGNLLSGDSDSKRDDSGYTESYSSHQRDDHGYSESHTSRRYGDDGSYSQTHSSSRRDDDGGYRQSQTSQYSQSGYQQTSSYGRQQSSSGGYSESQSYSSQQHYGAAASYQGSIGGGYGGSRGGESRYQSQQSQQSSYGGRDRSPSSRYGQREESHSGGYGGGYGGDSRHGRRDESPSSRHGGHQSGYGGGSSYQRKQRSSSGGSSDDHRRQQGGYGGRDRSPSSRYGQREESRSGGYGGGYGGDSRHGRRDESPSSRHGSHQSGYGGGSSYQRRQRSSSGGSSDDHRRQQGGYGGRQGGDSRYQSQQSSYGGGSSYQRRHRSSSGGSSDDNRRQQGGYGGRQGGDSRYQSQQQSGYGNASQYQGSQGGYGGSQGGYGGSQGSSYGGGYDGSQGDSRYQGHHGGGGGGSASQYQGSHSQGGYGGYGNTGRGGSGYQEQRRW